MNRTKWNVFRRVAALTVFFAAGIQLVWGADAVKEESSATELLFYLPFESGNEPAWASGSTTPLYNSDASEYVDGLFGKAALYDRIPRPNSKTGWMNYFLGSTYSGIDNLPLEEGTFELWFNADPAMLEHPYDQRYYFFSVNRSAGMQLYLTRQKEKMELVYAEGETNFRWPQGERNFKLHEKRHPVETTDFFGQWHHIALVFNQEGRKVYLDGQEVIHQEAIPQSPVSSIDLNVAWGGRLGPYTFYGLLDEFRIWKGCRYLQNFIPEKTALLPEGREFPKSGTGFDGGRRRPKLQVENIQARGEVVEILLRSGNNRHQVRFSLNDGMPYLLYCEPGRQLGRARLDVDPEPEKLMLDQIEADGTKTIRGRAEKYQLRWKLEIAEKAGHLVFDLQLENEEQGHMLPLQPEITLVPADDQQWQGFFDGTGEHATVMLQEEKQGVQGIGMIFPVNAAWNDDQGLALAFAPESFFSWIFQGRRQNELVSAWRTVLNPQSSAQWKVELYPFDPRYRSDDAIARYHEAHPEFFRQDPACDWRVYTGSAYGTEAFYAKKYWKESKLEYFSGQELNRRLGNYWQWYYRSGESTGDWAITRFFNDNSPKFNGLFGALPPIDVHHQTRSQAFENLEGLGIAQNFYFLPWMERRYVKYFTDSQINVFDVDNTQYYYDGWWRGGMRDYVVMPWGTRAGDFFRDSIDKIMRQYPQIDGFAFDVLEGNHRFRGHSNLNAERAYDQSGVFVDFMLGYAKIGEFIKGRRRENGMKYTLTGNPHIWRTTFPALFRMDNIIFEGRYFEYINATPQLRHVSRFMGSKGSSLYQSGRTDYVGNYYPNSADFNEEQAAAVTAVYHVQTFLRCMLNNLRPTPHLINGFTELQEGMLDFKQLMRYEYNYVSAVQTQMPVQAARYGHPESGIAVLVNPDLKEQGSALAIDCGYLECVPLLGISGETASSLWQGTTTKLHGVLSIKPLSWQLLQMPGALKFAEAGALAYRSQFSADGVERSLVCTFDQVPGCSVELLVRLLPIEQLRQCQLNGREIKAGEAFQLQRGDQLSIRISDKRWMSKSADVLDFPFLQSHTAVCCDPQTETVAQRLVEYFRFWTANTPGQEKRELALIQRSSDNVSGDKPRVLVSTTPPRQDLPEQGVWRQGSILYVWAPAESLMQMTDAVLDLLDQKYPSPGRLGYQNTDADFEFAAVASQKTLQKNIAGKRYQVEKVLPAFYTIPYPKK